MSTPPSPIAAAVPPAQPSQPGLSEPARIVNTFVAPSKTFLDIRQNASWWVPLLLMSIFAIAFGVTLDKKVGYDQIAHNTLSKSSRFEQAPADQQAQQLKITAAILKYSSYASPIFILFFAVITTLVLWGTFNFGFAAEVSFGQAMAIVMYGWLPNVVSSILAMVSVYFGNPEGFRMESPVGTNPGYYMDPHTTSKFVLAALSSFDVIGLWIVALIGIGFAMNAKKKLSTGTAIGVVAAWYFLVKLIGAGFAAMQG
jgi:Yip1 domain